MPIVPDDKDWTWVLERPCPECGFDAATVPPVVAVVSDGADEAASGNDWAPSCLRSSPIRTWFKVWKVAIAYGSA